MKCVLTRLALACALCAAACSNQRSDGNAPHGSLKISSSATSYSTATGPAEVCGTFSLQPYIPQADGTPQNAGNPVVFTSTAANANDASAVTDQILGCIDGTNDNAGYNWGYIVTVTDFTDCMGTALTDVSPSTTTVNVPVECMASIDVPVSIHVSVAVSAQSTGGYVDITAGVNATDVQVGCKQADIDPNDGLLHFGESYIDPNGNTFPGLVALDEGTPTQFGGTVNGSVGTDTYYTGDIAPTAVHTIYQTFLSPCSNGTSEYADTNHAQCVSDNSGTPGGTLAELADAFVEVPGTGFAAVSVTSTGGLQIYSGSSNPGDPNIMNVTPTVVTDFNTLLAQTILATDASLTGFTVTGVFVDQSTPYQFVIAAVTKPGGTPEYATLSYASGAWSLSSFAVPTQQEITCTGLYSTPASCFVPGCTAPAPTCTEIFTDTTTYINTLCGNGFATKDLGSSALEACGGSFGTDATECSASYEAYLAGHLVNGQCPNETFTQWFAANGGVSCAVAAQSQEPNPN